MQRKTLDLAAHFRHAENFRKRLLTADGGVQEELFAVDAASLFAEKMCTAVLLELHATYTQFTLTTTREHSERQVMLLSQPF